MKQLTEAKKNQLIEQLKSIGDELKKYGLSHIIGVIWENSEVLENLQDSSHIVEAYVSQFSNAESVALMLFPVFQNFDKPDKIAFLELLTGARSA